MECVFNNEKFITENNFLQNLSKNYNMSIKQLYEK